MRHTGTIDDLTIQLKVTGLPPPVREHRFDVTRRWRFDLAWVAQRLAVEVEGGTWGQGPSRHTTPAGYEADCIKYAEAAIQGWCVIRVTAKMIQDGRALEVITRALAGREVQ